jgi:hypothetical protein
VTDDLLSELCASPQQEIAWLWEYIDEYYRALWPEHWEPDDIRGRAGTLHVLLLRRFFRDYAPKILSYVGEQWWPPDIPQDPQLLTHEWRLDERAADCTQWTTRFGIAPSDSLQGRLTHSLHWAKLTTGAYVEEELTRLNANRMKPHDGSRYRRNCGDAS